MLGALIRKNLCNPWCDVNVLFSCLSCPSQFSNTNIWGLLLKSCALRLTSSEGRLVGRLGRRCWLSLGSPFCGRCRILGRGCSSGQIILPAPLLTGKLNNFHAGKLIDFCLLEVAFIWSSAVGGGVSGTYLRCGQSKALFGHAYLVQSFVSQTLKFFEACPNLLSFFVVLFAYVDVISFAYFHLIIVDSF